MFEGGIGGIFSTFSGLVGSALWILGGGVFVCLLGFLAYFFLYKKKKWNLKVEFKLPRSDGRFVKAEWGKGSWNKKRGKVFLKRKRMNSVDMEPFPVVEYLQGDNILTVVQISPGHYKPVKPDSFVEVKDVKTGEKKSLIELSGMFNEFEKEKAWKTYSEREAKETYSVLNLLREYAPYLTIGLVIVLWGLQFVILYMKVT